MTGRSQDDCRDAAKIDDAPAGQLARSVDQWLVVKVGDGPRLVTTAAQLDRDTSTDRLNGHGPRAQARRPASFPWEVLLREGSADASQTPLHCAANARQPITG